MKYIAYRETQPSGLQVAMVFEELGEELVVRVASPSVGPLAVIAAIDEATGVKINKRDLAIVPIEEITTEDGHLMVDVLQDMKPQEEQSHNTGEIFHYSYHACPFCNHEINLEVIEDPGDRTTAPSTEISEPVDACSHFKYVAGQTVTYRGFRNQLHKGEGGAPV